jgi:ribosomal protein S27AE
MFPFHWIARKAKDVLAEGVFDRKDCGPEQRCRIVKIMRRTYAYFIIPIETGDELDRYLECGKCHRRYSPDAYRPADAPTGNNSPQRFEPVTWSCPKCGQGNPNDRYRCGACRYSLV